MARAQLHALISGRVQGVGYRATTHAEALRRGLAGWVRNRSDGSVEVLAAGERLALEEFLRYLQEGPRLAHVTGVAVDWGVSFPDAPFPFEVRGTL